MLEFQEGGRPESPAPDSVRRATLMRLGALCGLALSGEALAALATPARPGAQAAAGLLAPDQLALTGVLAELIIPKTETPGALAVGAHRTISRLLQVCLGAKDRQQFVAGLARIDAVARADGGKRFVALTPARQVALLHALDQGRAPFDGDDRRFFMQLKSLTAFAYYTSEVGATRELAYLPVPGGFKGNVPLKQIGRNWAL